VKKAVLLVSSVLALAAVLPGCVVVVHRDYDSEYSSSSSHRKLIGVEIGEVGPALAAQTGVDAGRASVVTRVMPGSPAEVAGIQRWDVITGVEGQPDGSYPSLRAGVKAKNHGETVELTLKRAGTELRVAPVVGAR
jgi:S1-C subfamily serine protease